MSRPFTSATIVMLAVGTALAGVGTWEADVTTQDGDAIVEPGETATIHISVDFSPRSGETDPDTGAPVMGFAGVAVEYLAADAWSSGLVSVSYNPHLWPLLDPTIDHDTQSVLGLEFFQYATGGFYADDPIWVTDLHWDPLGDYSPRRAGIGADARGDGLFPDDQLLVYEGYGSFSADLIDWTLPPETFTFEVVPAPAGASIIALGAPSALRRRRISSF